MKLMEKWCRSFANLNRSTDSSFIQSQLQLESESVRSGKRIAKMLNIAPRIFLIHTYLRIECLDNTVKRCANGLATLLLVIAEEGASCGRIKLLRLTGRVFVDVYRKWAQMDMRRLRDRLGSMRYNLICAARQVEAEPESKQKEKEWLETVPKMLEEIDTRAERIGGPSLVRQIRLWVPERIPILNDIRQIKQTCEKALFDKLHDDLVDGKIDLFEKNLLEFRKSLEPLIAKRDIGGYEESLDFKESLLKPLQEKRFNAGHLEQFLKIADYWVTTVQSADSDDRESQNIRTFFKRIHDDGCPIALLVEAFQWLIHRVLAIQLRLQQLHKYHSS